MSTEYQATMDELLERLKDVTAEGQPVVVGHFGAVDSEGKRMKVAPVIPETEEQQRRYEDAGRRREIRRSELERRRKIR